MYSKSKPRQPSAAQLEAMTRRYTVSDDGKLIIKSRDKTHMPKVGSFAGTINSKGHLSVSVLKSRFRVHHIVWFLIYGEFPKAMVVHRDGNRQNNSIENLIMLDAKAVQS